MPWCSATIAPATAAHTRGPARGDRSVQDVEGEVFTRITNVAQEIGKGPGLLSTHSGRAARGAHRRSRRTKRRAARARPLRPRTGPIDLSEARAVPARGSSRVRSAHNCWVLPCPPSDHGARPEPPATTTWHPERG